MDVTEFIRQGIKSSARLRFEQQKVYLAQNDIDQLRSSKFLPNFNVTTNHGILPVAPFSDPNQDVNIDWSEASLLHRVEFQLVQPVTTWGAINKAIEAARALAKAEEAKFIENQLSEEEQLFGLYQARVLTLHLEGLIREATETLDDAKKRLGEMDSSELSYKDEYELKIFEQEFEVQKIELKEQARFVADMWALALGEDFLDKIVLPDIQQMQMLSPPEASLVSFLEHAKRYAPEPQQARAALLAADAGLAARKKSFIPMVYFGLGGEYVRTPIPVAQQPLIGNRNSYANFVYSFGFRFNLSFSKMQTELRKSRIQLNQATRAQQAARQLAYFQVREAFRDYMVSRERVERTRNALDLANEWLRQEQVDYDLEIGNLEHLVDAVKKSLEYKVSLAQHIHEYNNRLSKLYTQAGYTLKDLSIK